MTSFLMRTVPIISFISLWLLFSCASQKRSHIRDKEKIIITATVTPVDSARLIIPSLNIDTLLTNGKVSVMLDAVTNPELTVTIDYPWKRDSTTFRDRADNKVKTIKAKNKFIIRFSKKILINAKQSKEYHLSFDKPVTIDKLDKWTSEDYFKTDRYKLVVTSGSHDSKLYEKYQNIHSKYFGQTVWNILDSLYRQSAVTDKIYNDFIKDAFMLNEKHNYTHYVTASKELIKNNLTNPVSPLILLKINKEYLDQSRSDFISLLNKMNGRAILSPEYRLAGQKLKEKVPLEPGTMFPLPVGLTPYGTEFAFVPSTSKYTLIELWAPWCVPCRKQNPEWNEILSLYKTRGFQIIGVSLYNDKKGWLKAIKEDQTENWLHVSDLEDGSFDGTNALTYNLEYIPYNFLIDSYGRIVLKEISTQQLKEFLYGKLGSAVLEGSQ